jgi:hypothetical protein
LPSWPRYGAGILTCFSFAPGRTAARTSRRGCPPQPARYGFPPRSTVRFPVALRAPTNPQTTAVVEEPSSTTAFRVLHMNTCYYYQDLLPGPVHAPARGRFNPASGIRPTRLRQVWLPGYPCLPAYRGTRTRPGIAHNRFDLVHFQGYPIRLVSCYALLSRCRLPWPLSSCRYGATPFRL